ncbi:alpha/beta fold hydrolase [Aurantivibrio infirmus]
MRESIVKIGLPSPLLGVLTEPQKLEKSDIAVLLLNSGVMHKVGTCRLSVTLARNISQNLGLQCLRFDFSGIGDSEARSSKGVDFDNIVVQEVIEVMDYMQKNRNIEKFILFGLCAGGHTACKAAEIDNRIMAIAQIDGYCFPTIKSFALYYFSRFTNLSAWKVRLTKWLGIRNALDSKAYSDVENSDFEVPDYAEYPAKSEVTKQLKKIMLSNVKMLCAFVGKEPYYRYRNQYRDCFNEVNFADNLEIVYLPDASHIITEPEQQTKIVSKITTWISKLA